MRYVPFFMLMTLAILGFEELSPAQSISQAANTTVDSQETMFGQPSMWFQSAIAQSLVVAQKPPQEKPDKEEKKPDKDGKKSSDRESIYKCLEYCSVVRQSCESLATIQPDRKIADIGSKENNEWSRDCQKSYIGCMNKCDLDESSVPWRRSKIKGANKDEKK